ncbi:MAG: hypothetical protein AABX89_07360 [Candidatus Thermoplasmatota archaeon]
MRKLPQGIPALKTLQSKHLPPFDAKEREEILLLLGGTYQRIGENKADNYVEYVKLQRRIRALFDATYAQRGWEAPPFQAHSLLRQAAPIYPSGKPLEHLALLRALFTDASQMVADQIAYRLRHGGNVHFEFTGPTGMGKSSCAIGLANDVAPIPPAKLKEHVSIDLGELPTKFKTKLPGDTIVLDEQLQTSGEGSRTMGQLLLNMEDTLRASMVNFFMVSPNSKEHSTIQAVLDLVLWMPKEKTSLFMVHLAGYPVGVLALRWMPDPLYKEYEPIKEFNTQRSLSGQFQDTAHTMRAVVQAFEDRRFTAYLSNVANKPKVADFKAAYNLYQGRMLSAGQLNQLAKFMSDLCQAYTRVKGTFEADFGMAAPTGLIEVAEKFYQE